MDKSKKRTNSTYALKELLTEVIAEPVQWHGNQELIAALKVQGKLSKWQDDERGIEPCSLNTLKNAAECLLDGGYGSLDQLRINALEAIERYVERKNAGNTRTKTGLQKKVKELEHQISILEQQNMMLVYLVTDLKEKAVKYAEKAPATTRALCEKEMRGVNAKISFSGNSDLLERALSRG